MSLNPYIFIGGLLVLILAFGSGYLDGRHDGSKITAAKYEAAQIVSDRAAADALAKATQSAKDIEHASQEAQVAASETYQKGLTHVTQTKDRVIAQLRAGTLRLRDPGSKYTLDTNPMSPIGASTGRCNVGEKTGFSDELNQFLVGEASRADSFVAQLTACQAIIKSDRDHRQQL